MPAWRRAARIAISLRIAPDDIEWNGAPGLFAQQSLPDIGGDHEVRVPRSFLHLSEKVIWHSAPDRFDMLYRALWRQDRGEGAPLSPADVLGQKLHLMAKSVGRDIHKMHAFVRFREIGAHARRRFVAWFEPEHNIVEPASPFFAKRFGDMDWLIATPSLVARFENGVLDFLPGGPRPDLPEDSMDRLWATYFSNIFNPARVKLNAMRAEMPKKYWHNLPETDLIPDMLRDAEARVGRMREAAASIPRKGSEAISTRYRAAMPQPVLVPKTMSEAEEAASQCRRCQLCEAATQTVWGEGDADAALMIVGEQPGDQEDLRGRPFVGPAGQLLRSAMTEAGLVAERVWLTNAVKHFKFTPRGKKRLHQNPDWQEVVHCRFWLGLEITLVQPRMILALGATAARSLTGNANPLTSRRGKLETSLHDIPVMISWHPSFILRLPDIDKRNRARQELIDDIRAATAMA